jgi:hypothetical protein
MILIKNLGTMTVETTSTFFDSSTQTGKYFIFPTNLLLMGWKIPGFFKNRESGY